MCTEVRLEYSSTGTRPALENLVTKFIWKNYGNEDGVDRYLYVGFLIAYIFRSKIIIYHSCLRPHILAAQKSGP